MRIIATLLIGSFLAAGIGCSKSSNPDSGKSDKGSDPAADRGLPPGVKLISEEEAFQKVKELGGRVVERTPMGKPLKDYILFDRAKVHGKDLTFLYSIPYLHELSFTQSDIQDDDLVQLRGLKEVSALGVQYTEVTDACLPHLEAMPKLAWISLSNTKVSREADEAFQKRIAPRKKKPGAKTTR